MTPFKFPPSPEFLYTFYCYFTLLSPYFLIFSFIYKCGDLWEVQNVFACPVCQKSTLVLRGEPNQPNLGLRKRMWGVYTYTLYIRSTGQDYRTIQQDE